MEKRRFLTENDKSRYIRSIKLDEIGEKGQLRIMESSVAVIGCGALGSVVSMYLAGAGVGEIVIADFDKVDISNLQRQISFGECDEGANKAGALKRRLQGINSSCAITAIQERVTPEMALDLFRNVDFVIEATDNPESTYMIADTCCELGKPCCIAGVKEFRAMITTCLPGHSSYRDIFPVSADLARYSGGVLGPLPGVVGSLQAAEAIKYITGAGRLLADRLLLIDLLDMNFTLLDV